MNPWVLFIVVASLGLGTTITFASSHWLLAWMGLEINTLAIIPLMAQHHHPRAVEAATKYFLTQAAAAAVMLFATASNAWLLGEWQIQQLSHPLSATATMVSLGMKVGLAPMHLWLPEVLQGLDLTTGLVLSTWQKLAPMILIFQLAPNVDHLVLLMIGLASTLIGGWGGLNQQSAKILAYSSIAHMGWLVMIIQFDRPTALMVMLTYIIMTTGAFLTMIHADAHTIRKLALAQVEVPSTRPLLAVVVFSLAGLPPLLGFMPKLLVLQGLANDHRALLAVLAALSSLLSLFFYLRLISAFYLTLHPAKTTTMATWKVRPSKMINPLALVMTSSILFLPLVPSLLAAINS
uniref:NADH-ubiquinone oxidoreductase chain 2 n=1 Tax=Fusigobius signipinnis TaxID=151726 RepID=Q94W50_9GOBI|nr:NADH dehydrogenase subunit 2 [Fusigobius signipinnis]